MRSPISWVQRRWRQVVKDIPGGELAAVVERRQRSSLARSSLAWPTCAVPRAKTVRQIHINNGLTRRGGRGSRIAFPRQIAFQDYNSYVSDYQRRGAALTVAGAAPFENDGVGLVIAQGARFHPSDRRTLLKAGFRCLGAATQGGHLAFRLNQESNLGLSGHPRSAQIFRLGGSNQGRFDRRRRW